MSADHRVSFDKLVGFVLRFYSIQRVNQNVHPFLNDDMGLDVKPHFISYKELVECSSDEEALILLGIAFAFRMPVCISSHEYFFLTDIFYVFFQEIWLADKIGF